MCDPDQLFTQPVPELPVKNVLEAQEYYRDILGFKIEWTIPGKSMGAASNDEVAIFFRETTDSFEPNVHWIFAPDVDVTYEKLKESGADIIDDIENKPWGLRQFTIKDLNGHIFHIHHDLPKDST